MKPVEQTRVGHPSGNCFCACIASILECPIETVPDFKGDEWRERYNEWLLPLGLAIVTIGLPDDAEEKPLSERRHMLPGYQILAVRSPRHDCLHAVVCHNGEIVWDPHPERHQGVGKWEQADLIVTLDPTKPAGKMVLAS